MLRADRAVAIGYRVKSPRDQYPSNRRLVRCVMCLKR